MLSTIGANMVAFGKSMPTNMVILVIILLIMKLAFKKKTSACIKVVLAYLLIGVLLGIFGIHMPDFLTIGRVVADFFKSIF